MNKSVELNNAFKHWCKYGLPAIVVFIASVIISIIFPVSYPWKTQPMAFIDFYNDNVSSVILIGSIISLYFGFYKGFLKYDHDISKTASGKILISQTKMFFLIPTNIPCLIIVLIALLYIGVSLLIFIVIFLLLLGSGSRNEWWY